MLLISSEWNVIRSLSGAAVQNHEENQDLSGLQKGHLNKIQIKETFFWKVLTSFGQGIEINSLLLLLISQKNGYQKGVDLFYSRSLVYYEH